MVGPSAAGAGRGLFVALNPGVDRTVLEKGTPICGYSKEGSWEVESSGDKCVAYAFANLEVGVFFAKELMSLLEAVSMVEGEVRTCVAGHEVGIHIQQAPACRAFSLPPHCHPSIPTNRRMHPGK